MSDGWWQLAGNSMWPLRAPLEVRLTPVPAHLDVGDVVAVLAPTAAGEPRVWLHRVERIEADLLQLRGDTNLRPDPPVPRSAVLGIVDAVRWGALVLPWPRGQGALAARWRGAGRLWAQLAPPLKRVVAKHLKKRRAGKT